VVVTDQDHEANSGAWRRLAAVGVEVREWRVDPASGRLALDDLDRVLDDDVALVAFPHVSNLVGEVNPVAAIAERAHAVDAVAVVDGVAAAPHGLPDVGALGVDAYLWSAYKVFGPHQGVLAITRQLADRLPNQGHWFNADLVTKKFVPAGPDHAQVAALAGVVDYLDALADHHRPPRVPGEPPSGREPSADRAVVDEAVRGHERALVDAVLAVVTDRPGVRVLGPLDPQARVPLLSVVTDRPPAELAVALAEHGIMAASGHFYARRLVEALGVDPTSGVLRLSLVHYNTLAEVDRLTAALDAVLPG
jgi:selenocysteine lyase/cysteine desulfurase